MPFNILWRRCLVLSGCLLALAGCSPKEHDAVVATVAGQPITLSEYETQYLRNAPSRDSAAHLSQADRERFLDLMVDYKLKLADAQAHGLQNKPSVRNEILQYTGGLTQSYVTDREIVQPALHAMYDRRKDEIRARHILLRLPANATPTDSALAYSKAHAILDSLKAGVPFDSLAKHNSIDPSAQQNFGDLYYFTGGMMVGPFEDAVFALQKGQTSLVRTQYGLHIVQVTDRGPWPGEIHCAHIMIRFPSMKPTPEDTLAALATIKKIQDSLKMGIDFGELAKRNSGDPGSAPKGGDLGWFSRRRWVQPFDEEAFKLKPGETSAIIRTPYGYHLIKCFGQRPMKTFDEMKQELSQQYQQMRAQSDYDNEVARLKKNLGFVLNDAPIREFLATCDTLRSTHDANWDSTLTPAVGRAVVFRAHGQEMTFDSVVSAIKQHTEYTPALLRFTNFMAPVEKVAEQFIWTIAADSFATKYPDFASLLSDYRDGVVLYQMEQENVWNKISASDSLLHIFFENNRQKFVWPDRLDITELRMVTPSAADTVAARLARGESFEQVEAEDSVRMARPIQWTITFPNNGTAVSPAMKKLLAAAAAEWTREPHLTLQLSAHADTGKGPDAINPRRHLEAVKKYLLTTLKVDSNHVQTVNIPLAPNVAGPSEIAKQRALQLRQVLVNLQGKLPVIAARPTSSLLAVSSDERAIRADSLAVGGTSKPFKFKEYYVIVRLNARDPSHRKTYDEAQPEVSAAYQDYESDQLKNEWIKNLRSMYPVQEHPELLREAFATTAK